MGVDAAATSPVEDAAWPHAASALLASLAAVAAALTAAALVRVDFGAVDWAAFGVFATGAALAHALAVEGVRGWSVRPAGVFVIAAVFVLPAGLAAPIVLSAFAVPFVLDPSRRRRQLFDAASGTLATLLAAGTLDALGGPLGGGVRPALAAAAACVVFVVATDTLPAVLMSAAGVRSIRETRLLAPSAFATALGMAALGVVTATAWRTDPWLLAFALAPLGVVYRALSVPRLVEESALDGKTQLYNAHRFAEALGELSDRAAREHTPLAVVMADLDFLREINNTYGHLAGDAVLRGVAEVIRASVRADDFAARFGGEEFAIILPDTGPEQALEIAERIRAAVEESEFRVDTNPEPIRATISVGVACFPRDAGGAEALVHAADVGLYRAKGGGRNRVVYAGAPA